MLTIIFLVCACLCFVFAAIWYPQPARPNLLGLGLAFYMLSILVQIKH
jgi:hypothetical protein